MEGTMKRKNSISVWELILLLLAFVVFGWVLTAAQEEIWVYKWEKDLVTRINLTVEQSGRVEKIKVKVKTQAEKDRERCQDNGIGLIASAERRRAMMDSLIENVLDQNQKEIFNGIKQDRGDEEELFLLVEGLLLDEKQIIQITYILEFYNQKIEEMFKRSEKMMENSMGGRNKGGRRSGGPPMGGGMRGGGFSRGRRGGRPGDGIEDLKKKKSKQIKKILTKKQKKMYKQIKGIVNTRFDSMIHEKLKKMRARSTDK
jgi:uncharacterized membrane protein YgcG